MKFLVFVLFFADTVNCIFDLVFMYSALIKNFSKKIIATLCTPFIYLSPQIILTTSRKPLGVRTITQWVTPG